MSVIIEDSINLGPHPQYPKSVKAGIPRLSRAKPGWKEVAIGDLFDVVSRPVSMKDEAVYNLVTVKRSRGGVVEREKLLGKKIAVKSQFYVEAGDFLISKRQIVHGACGFVPVELNRYIVSNEYSVLRCRDAILPEFLNYLMHTPYFQQTCFHSSIGIHVEKLIFKLDDWFKWRIYLPSIEGQKNISDFLSSIDDKINKLRHKRDLLEAYKLGLMQNFSHKNCVLSEMMVLTFLAGKKKILKRSLRLKEGVDCQRILFKLVGGIIVYCMVSFLRNTML